jgi:cohesin complex subunit SA-1/2
LRDAVAGREELELATFKEDEVSALSHICARLAIFAKIRNMISWIEEDEGGKQSSAWDIVSALAERGRLGYKEEETVCGSNNSVSLSLILLTRWFRKH